MSREDSSSAKGDSEDLIKEMVRFLQNLDEGKPVRITPSSSNISGKKKKLVNALQNLDSESNVQSKGNVLDNAVKMYEQMLKDSIKTSSMYERKIAVRIKKSQSLQQKIKVFEEQEQIIKDLMIREANDDSQESLLEKLRDITRIFNQHKEDFREVLVKLFPHSMRKIIEELYIAHTQSVEKWILYDVADYDVVQYLLNVACWIEVSPDDPRKIRFKNFLFH